MQKLALANRQSENAIAKAFRTPPSIIPGRKKKSSTENGSGAWHASCYPHQAQPYLRRAAS